MCSVKSVAEIRLCFVSEPCFVCMLQRCDEVRRRQQAAGDLCSPLISVHLSHFFKHDVVAERRPLCLFLVNYSSAAFFFTEFP